MPALLAATLAISFGTTVANNLLKGLNNRRGGAQKLEAAAAVPGVFRTGLKVCRASALQNGRNGPAW